MTIETARSCERPSRWRGVEAAGCALAGWLVLVATVTVLVEPTREAIVFGAPASTLGFLAGSDSRIVDVRDHYLIVRGSDAGFVRQLYANGAWLVLPVRANGCFGLRGGS